MKRGYVRVSKAGPTLDEQREALAKAGITDFSDAGPVYVDMPPKGRRKPGADARLERRTDAIKGLRAGDVLVVSSPARLGTSTEDIMAVLAEIGRRQASVFDCSTRQTVEWHPQAAEVVAFAAAAETERRQEITRKARRVAAELGAVRGAARKLTPKRRAEAQALWADVLLTAAQVEERTGVPVRTLYRLFGPRGTPHFGKVK